MDFPVMRRASHWNGYLFCALLAFMTLYALPKSASYLGSEQETPSLYMDGELARDFENTFDRDVPLRNLSIHFWGNLQYLLFREGQSGVVIGRDHWLFSNEELILPGRFDLVLADHMEDIVSVRDRLQGMGIRLIMIPVPMKATVYEEQLGRRLNPRLLSLEQQFPAQLQAAGIEHLPLFEGFRSHSSEQQLFMARDTHWTPAGARLAAGTVAAAYPELQGSNQYRLIQNGPQAHAGDLTRFIRTSSWVAGGVRAPETLPDYEIEPVLAQLNEDVLFGDLESPLLLIGSSYSAMDQWNFTGFLQQALSRDLVSLAESGKGPYYAMWAFLDSPPDWAGTVDTVLWEFPVRTLLNQERRQAIWQESLKRIY